MVLRIVTQGGGGGTLVKFHDLMKAHICYPGITIIVNLQTMGHVEQTRPIARLHLPFVSIKS